MPHTIDKDDVINAMQGRFVDFYGQHTELKPDGGQFRGACPLHGGDGPNFTVDPDTGEYYCHSKCGEGGDVFKFVQKMQRLTFPEAVQVVAQWVGVSDTTPAVRKPSLPKPAQAKPALPPVFLDPALAADAHAALMSSAKRQKWLAEHRGLTEDTLRRFQIGMHQDDKDKAAGVWRVTFPVFDAQGRLTNIRRHLFAYKPELTDEKRAKLNKTLPYQSGLTAGLFPLSVLSGTEGVLLVGGEPDAVLANQLGLAAVTGTSGEGTWKAEWTDALHGKCVTVLYDNDDAGRKGAQKVAEALHAAGVCVSVASYPEGVKDLTEWVVTHGATADAVRVVIDNASPMETTPTPAAPAWPEADAAVYHGLAGDFVRAIDPHTESDPLAIHLQFLAAYGNVIGRTAYFQTEADQHFGNLFVTIVGVSSKGRKGTSAGHVRRIFESVEPAWQADRVQAGLSSGEGLIHAVRDPIEKQERNKLTKEMETVTVDEGVDDKRLFVLEGEYASVLKQTQRDGNTLSTTMRCGWDTGNLGSLVKNSPTRATGAHISIVGHITDTELRKELAETETANGFGNRVLWACVKRSKLLPEGGDIGSVNMAPLLSRLRLAIAHAQETDRLMRDDAARTLWHAVYPDLSSGKPGLLGALTGRAEAQVMRLALLYALLDCDTAIRAVHLTAALALWEYCEASVRYIFGDAIGDATADALLNRLRSAPEGMTRTQISAAMGRNVPAARLQQALDLLASYGYAHAERQTTGGAPSELWKATGTK